MYAHAYCSLWSDIPTHANTVHACVIIVQDVVDIPVDDIHIMMW